MPSSQSRSVWIRRWALAGALAVAVVVGVAAWAVHRWVPGQATAATPVANHAFLSAAKPQAPALLWAVGDGGDGSKGARQVATLVRRGNPARVLYLGDVYEVGTAKEFREGFASTFAGQLHRIAPTPGNHEWPNHADGYDPFWKGVTGAQTPPWYAFDIGGWRVLSLNSEVPTDSRQLSWLKRELARHPGTCLLPIMHRPRFNAGEHGDDASVEPMWKLLVGRVPAVLAGHDHNMQRLKSIQGTTQYISGAGGHSHYDVNTGDARVAFGNGEQSGALRIQLAPGRATFTFYDVAGRELDRSAARCGR